MPRLHPQTSLNHANKLDCYQSSRPQVTPHHTTPTRVTPSLPPPLLCVYVCVCVCVCVKVSEGGPVTFIGGFRWRHKSHLKTLHVEVQRESKHEDPPSCSAGMEGGGVMRLPWPLPVCPSLQPRSWKVRVTLTSLSWQVDLRDNLWRPSLFTVPKNPVRLTRNREGGLTCLCSPWRPSLPEHNYIFHDTKSHTHTST